MGDQEYLAAKMQKIFLFWIFIHPRGLKRAGFFILAPFLFHKYLSMQNGQNNTQQSYKLFTTFQF